MFDPTEGESEGMPARLETKREDQQQKDWKVFFITHLSSMWMSAVVGDG